MLAPSCSKRPHGRQDANEPKRLNFELQRTLPRCGWTRASVKKRSSCSRPSTAGSPKALRRRTSNKQRLCSINCGERTTLYPNGWAERRQSSAQPASAISLRRFLHPEKISLELLPFLFFFWRFVYEEWFRQLFFLFLGRKLFFDMLFDLSLRLSILFDCLLRGAFSQFSPIIQVAVLPFEIDVPGHMNLDDCTGPLARFVALDMVFEQLDVILADAGCKQLAEIC